MNISILKGKILTEVRNVDNQELIFVVSDSEQYRMYHLQDCCESVSIDDIVGDLNDLLNSPITLAEEVTSTEDAKVSCEWPDEGEPGGVYKCYDESHTWTFYKLATVKGYVDIKWYGSSNGYYSESVNFIIIGSDEDYSY